MFIWNYLVCWRPPCLGLHLSLPLPPSCLAFNTVPAWFQWNPRRLWSCSSMIKVEAQNGFWSTFVLRNMQMNCEQTSLWRDLASTSCNQSFLFTASQDRNPESLSFCLILILFPFLIKGRQTSVCFSQGITSVQFQNARPKSNPSQESEEKQWENWNRLMARVPSCHPHQDHWRQESLRLTLWKEA